MSYETLVMQNVVASIEATDDICKRFVPFAKRLVERPADFHFKLGARTCKIAPHKSQFAVDDRGGCAGQIVIETEADQPRESRLGFKLTHGARDGGARLTLTFNPSQLLAAADVAPTLKSGRRLGAGISGVVAIGHWEVVGTRLRRARRPVLDET